MKKILGLDLGTTSVGWALIEKDALFDLNFGFYNQYQDHQDHPGTRY